jgi:hypothetical protein
MKNAMRYNRPVGPRRMRQLNECEDERLGEDGRRANEEDIKLAATQMPDLICAQVSLA